MLPIASIVFGVLLCALSVLGMIGSAEKLATAFVPMMFGIPLVITGIVALNPHRGRVAIPVAATVALLGFITAVACAVYRVGEIAQGEKTNLFAFELVGGLAGLSGGFLVIWLVVLLRNRSRRTRRPRGFAPPKRPSGKHRIDAANPS